MILVGAVPLKELLLRKRTRKRNKRFEGYFPLEVVVLQDCRSKKGEVPDVG